MMVSMLLVLAGFAFYWKVKGAELKLLPKKIGSIHIATTAAAALFLAITLFWVKGFSPENLLLIVYAGIVTPVFEELLFRGFFWNRLSSHVKKEWVVYLIVTILFGLWHIGYAVGIYLWQGGSLLLCIAMKVLWGTMYGFLLGFIRLKTRNCYLGILAHGVLNVFG
ncbi:MAG: lysostaphin resistance A-like protein [Aristaeellaceae bacterium]